MEGDRATGRAAELVRRVARSRRINQWSVLGSFWLIIVLLWVLLDVPAPWHKAVTVRAHAECDVSGAELWDRTDSVRHLADMHLEDALLGLGKFHSDDSAEKRADEVRQYVEANAPRRYSMGLEIPDEPSVADRYRAHGPGNGLEFASCWFSVNGRNPAFSYSHGSDPRHGVPDEKLSEFRLVADVVCFDEASGSFGPFEKGDPWTGRLDLSYTDTNSVFGRSRSLYLRVNSKFWWHYADCKASGTLVDELKNAASAK